MADSFFGFNTVIGGARNETAVGVSFSSLFTLLFTLLQSIDENEDGGTFEASEDEYDALNDETFGETGTWRECASASGFASRVYLSCFRVSADDGDWEQQHEQFSLVTESTKHIDIGELRILLFRSRRDERSR